METGDDCSLLLYRPFPWPPAPPYCLPGTTTLINRTDVHLVPGALIAHGWLLARTSEPRRCSALRDRPLEALVAHGWLLRKPFPRRWGPAWHYASPCPSLLKS